MSKVRLVAEGRTEWELIHNLRIGPQPDLLSSIPNPALEPLLDAEGQAIPFGKDSLLDRLQVVLDEPGQAVVIVVCDAEGEKAAGTWGDVRIQLAERGYDDVPEEMAADGVIVSKRGGKRVGVWIMPNNADEGMIEDFFWNAIPDTEPEKDLAREFVERIPEPRKFKKKVSKAKLYAWLAVQKDPSAHPWQAFGYKWIKEDLGDVPAFLNWLERLLTAA
jgi:hypothetical protein